MLRRGDTLDMENKKCQMCATEFSVDDEDIKFIEDVSPIIAGKKYLIPTPRTCPDCREQTRLVWRNDRHIFKRKSDKTGNEIIAIYPPNNKEFKIWESNLWSKDDWNPSDFGRDYDQDRSFFDQVGELTKDVPRQATNATLNENSDYSNQTWKSKNLYLCFNVGPAEDCYYCSEAWFVKDCVDCLYVKNSEYCYLSFNVHNSSHCYYSEQLTNCTNTYFSFDCIGCNNVLFCTNLRNKSYCIENKEYSKEEYEKKVHEYGFEKRSNVISAKKRFDGLKAKAIRKENNNQKTENCSGDYLFECKDCKDCYYSHTSVNCHRVINIDNDAKDCRDCDFITEADYCYGSTSVAGHKNNFSVWLEYGSNNLYSNFCAYCSDCLGCVGLRHKQYCILNKQYSKEEYEILAAKIIEKMTKDGEWGEFMPMKYSYFNYNESVSNLFFPKTKAEAEKLGAKWQDEDYSLKFDGEAYEPLDDINEYKDEQKQKKLLSGILKCEKTGKAFRIMPQELVFYLKHIIPIPTSHPEERYMELFRSRNPRKLFKRRCDCSESGHDHEGRCDIEFQTTFAPERPEIVYCESCYQKSVV